MGERGEGSRLRGAEAAAATWERRKAEQAARTAAAMADPVLRFYRRHGHPAARGVLVTTCAAAAPDDEPGTA